MIGQRFYYTEHFTFGRSSVVSQEEGQDPSAMFRLLAVE